MTKPIIAAFDFDGTLTHKDTFLPFLKWVENSPWFYFKLVFVIPAIVGYLLRIVSRQTLKEKILQCFLGNMPAATIQHLGKEFASTQLPNYLKKNVVDRIHWHKSQAHRCILVSANLDLFLVPWAKSFGFNDVITSKCEIIDEILSGKLIGKNCRGAEKVDRLIKLVGEKENYTLYAYGDSKGDRELLAYADYPHLIKNK